MATTISRAALNALVNDSGSNLDGSIWDKATIAAVIHDAIDALLAAASIEFGGVVRAPGGFRALTASSTPGDGGMYRHAITGFTFQAVAGSSYDVALVNPGNLNFIWRVPSGTVNLEVLGTLTVMAAGTHSFSAGTSGSNILGIRNTTDGAGAAAFIQIGNDATATLGLLQGHATNFGSASINNASAILLRSTGAGGLDIAATHASGPIRIWAGGVVLRGTVHTTGGLVWGVPTGGDKGSGTINAQAVYDDNVLLSDWLFDLYFDGTTRDPSYRGQALYSLAETHACAARERRLPWMPTRAGFEVDRGVGSMISRLWQGQEQQQVYLFELEARLRQLEAS